MVKAGMIDIHSETLEAGDFDTVITQDIDFSGKLVFEKPLLIQGKVFGVIESGGLLVIDDGAVVEANISAGRVIIRGAVKGDVRAGGQIEISATGKLDGNVTVPPGGLLMEAGCIFNGRCVMREEGEAATA